MSHQRTDIGVGGSQFLGGLGQGVLEVGDRQAEQIVHARRRDPRAITGRRTAVTADGQQVLFLVPGGEADPHPACGEPANRAGSVGHDPDLPMGAERQSLTWLAGSTTIRRLGSTPTLWVRTFGFSSSAMWTIRRSMAGIASSWMILPV